MKELRSYQKTAINKVISSKEKGQIVVLPTGTGKTFTTCKLIADNFERCLWITHREELIDQSGLALALTLSTVPSTLSEKVEQVGGFLNYIDWRAKTVFDDQLMPGIGVIKAERMTTNEKFVVASVQTLWRRLDKLDVNLFDVIVIDECHLAMAKTWKMCVEHFNAKLRIGLTATPHRADGLSLLGLFDKITYSYDLPNAIQDGWLVPINAIRCETQLDINKVKTTAGDFNIKDLSHVVDCTERNNLIVDKYEAYGQNKQAIFYCVDILHATHLRDVFRRRGHECETVVSNTDITPDRRATLRKFKQNKLKIITNVDILTTGFDYPDLAVIGTACPTKSLVKYIQTIGRGTRPIAHSIVQCTNATDRREAIRQSSKPELILLDFVDVTSRHRLVNAWTLDKGKKAKDKVFVNPEKREKLLEAEQRREATIDRIVKGDKKVNLIPLPEIKISKSKKMKEPATDKQLAFLSRLGYNADNIYTKADASLIISQQQAEPWMIKELRDNNFDADGGTTLGEYQEAKVLIKMKNNKPVSDYHANKYNYKPRPNLIRDESIKEREGANGQNSVPTNQGQSDSEPAF